MTFKTPLLISALVLTACSGSSSSTDPVPPPMIDTRPPVFANGATASVDTTENNTDVLTTLSATDPSGGTVTLSLVSDEDSGFFTFESGTGELRFTTARDFETPEDSDADNSYVVRIEATDNDGNRATQTLTITVTDETDTASLEQVATGLSRPVGLVPIPGDTRMAVVQQRGRVRLLDPETGAIDSVDFLTISGLAAGGEQGLLGLAFAPDFQESGEFYVNLTVEGTGRTEIRRYQSMSGRRDMGDPATADVILAIDQPRSNHNAGWIGFAPDGLLLVPTGDGGGGGDPFGNAQDSTALLGKILRLDISADSFPTDPERDYAIPPGNAFANAADGAPEIYALGLRNPFQSTIDPASGDLIIADVGQGQREEINRLSLTDGAGTNFGWNVREGTVAFTGTSAAVLTDPVAEYPHDDTDRGGFSVTGGVVHQGTVEALQTQYLFADFVTDNIWSLPLADLVNGITIPASDFTVVNPVADIGTVDGVSAFATGPDGTSYVVLLRGDIYRFVSAD